MRSIGDLPQSNQKYFEKCKTNNTQDFLQDCPTDEQVFHHFVASTLWKLKKQTGIVNNRVYIESSGYEGSFPDLPHAQNRPVQAVLPSASPVLPPAQSVSKKGALNPNARSYQGPPKK